MLSYERFYPGRVLGCSVEIATPLQAGSDYSLPPLESFLMFRGKYLNMI